MARSPLRHIVALFVSTVLVAAFVMVSAGPAAAVGDILPGQQGLPDLDTRTGSVQATAGQQAIVDGLGAAVRWNRFGTPQSLIRYGGFLASGVQGADAVSAARSWIAANAALFRLSAVTDANLKLLNDSPLVGTQAHAVIFDQYFGSLPAAQDGMITVGLTGNAGSGWNIAYVSSSAAGRGSSPPAAKITATQAWIRAAASVGRTVTPADISAVRKVNGWSVFSVAGFATPLVTGSKGDGNIDQRARLVALPTYTQGIRSAYESIVLDVQGGRATAYTVFVDAVSGDVLLRLNRVQQLAAGFHAAHAPAAPTSGFFTGTTDQPGSCGPMHDIPVPAGTKSIDVVASADDPVNDIVLLLFDPNGNQVASADTATSPEAIHYAPTGGVPDGTWDAQVCQFDPTQPPFQYTGAYFTNDVAGTSFPYPPEWKFFRAYPLLGGQHPPFDLPDTDTRIVGCWEDVPGLTPPCQLVLMNQASRAPWDHDVQSNLPTFTTRGNNANTAEAWTSPLTPGPLGQRPVDMDRHYIHDWTNQWNSSLCDPTVLGTPGSPNSGGADVLAAVVNLFAGHNLFHDFSYRLGFTEQNFNMQTNNFGNTAPGPYPNGREQDPETGDVQAGALTGGAPTYEGRDNANQITLNDGIPGITNQYLFQPIAGAFYSPCVDGDYDTTVFGHEFTHAISNRMVGGPDANLTGYQAGSMGESWSDLDALEYLHEYNLVPVSHENPWAEGAYVTGNFSRGIRDYPLNVNPLNYSDLGFDVPGPEVHADGEVWNGTNYDIRQALVKKYNAQFPESDTTLERQCADGILPPDQCPGNRRWIQIVYDAWLLMPPAVSMLDARDAYLAADVLRFGGANQAELWNAFARRGMGENASSNTNADSDPVPGFTSPFATEGTVQFNGDAIDQPGRPHVNAKIYVGNYEARVTPIADTDSTTPLSATASFVPGTYDFVAQADGYGLVRFKMNIPAGSSIQRTLHFATNWASIHQGAVPSGDGVNQDKLLDDTEGTDWASLGSPVGGQEVTVQLAGGEKMVRLVTVSAMLHPADANDPNDSGSQSRFSALRQFRIEACDTNTALGGICDGTTGIGFSTIYTSPANAFPGVVPRPVAPDLTFRTFDVPDTMATHVRLVVMSNQCTGGPDYQGEQDNDPTNPTDCTTGSAQAENVRAAELEVFGADFQARNPQDPVVLLTMQGPSTAQSGSVIDYSIGYANLGPSAASKATIRDVLPAGVTFVSATNGGRYDAGSRAVTWKLGTVGNGASGAVGLTVRIVAGPGSVVLNQATFDAAKTLGVPAAAATLVT